MTRRATLLITLLLGATLAPALAARTDDEGELSRLRRDQSRLGMRLQNLREKMERLAARYEEEGRTRNAALLRDAIERYDARKLEGLVGDLDRLLGDGMLSTVERQDEMVEALEDIYAVLRDRSDLEDLQRQEQLARQGAEELGYLAEDQRRLLARTRAQTDRAVDLLDASVDDLGELQAELEALEASASRAREADARLNEVGLAEELARAQRQLAADPRSATSRRQAEIEAALERLRASLEQRGDGDSELMRSAELSRDVARAAAEEAADAMRAAREALARRESGDGERDSGERPEGAAEGASGDGDASVPASDGASGEANEGTSSEGRSGRTAAERGAGAERSGEAADRENEVAGASGEAGEAVDDARETGTGGAGGEAADAESGEPSESGADEASEQSGEPGADEPTSSEGAAAGSRSSSSGSPSSSSPSPESRSAGPGESSPRSGGADEPTSSEDPADAQEEAGVAMDRAAELLEDVRDALQRAERSLAAQRNRSRAEADRASRAARDAAAALAENAERLEGLQPEEGPELLDRTRELLERAERTADEVERGDLSNAASASERMQPDINDLLAQLERRRAAADPNEESGADPEALAELAAQQADIEQRTRDLMRRLQELPDQEFQDAAQRAAQSMASAQEALQSGDTRRAEQEEERAAEELEQARDELSGDRDRYEQLRQDEVLFRLGEDLASLLERQIDARDQTAEVDEARDGEARLSRSQRRTVARLAATERELADDAERLRAGIAEDGAIAFTFILEQTTADLDAVADLLDEQRTDPMVLSMQDEVIQRLQDLIAVLEEELERRRDAEVEDAEGQQGQQGQQPLVPPVAELLALKRMEESALLRLERFIRMNPQWESEEPHPVELEILERWAIEHLRVTELFEELVPQPPEETQVDGAVRDGDDGDDGEVPPEEDR